MKKVKKDFFVFTIGVFLGYCLIQGLSFVHHQYLWILFHQG